MPDVGDLFEGVDEPRALPAGLHDRLEAALVAAPMPRGVAVRLERRLVPAGQRSFGLVAAAAALVLVAGAAVVSTRQTSTGPRPVAQAPVSPIPSSSPTPGVRPPAPVPAPVAPPAPPVGAVPGSATGGGTAPGESRVIGPAPPFSGAAPAAPAPAPASGGQPAPGSPAPTQQSRPPVTIDLRGGADSARAFQAYIDIVNEAGGVNYRLLRVNHRDVGVDPTRPEPGSVVTVNLNRGRTIASTFRGGPLLETDDITETDLVGDVFDMSSAVERQAHLAVDAVFPDASPGSTAVIVVQRPSDEFSGETPYDDEVPEAYEAVLRERGVETTRIQCCDQSVPPFVDALFVSLPDELMGTFFEENPLLPPRVAGTGSMLNEKPGIVPAGVLIVSPFRLPGQAEADTIRKRAATHLRTPMLHGWLTAKALVYALWRSDADTRAEVSTALRDLRGYDGGGLMPPYAWRPNTRSRTPEGMVYRRVDGGFSEVSGFRTDPH